MFEGRLFDLVTTDRPTVFTRACPRCSVEVSGWIINEAGFVSCLSCGFVLQDPGYKSESFEGVFKEFEGKVIPSESAAKWEFDRKLLYEHAGLTFITFTMSKCCDKHQGKRLSACTECRTRYDAMTERLYNGQYINSSEMCSLLRFVNGISK